ncbi:MAG: pentapeptide repeat-containing protein [Blautia sp.]|nr:pentapeptide repeat-containing protein [Blautia sp.]
MSDDGKWKGVKIMQKIGEVFSKQEIASAADFLKTLVPLEPLRDAESSFEGINQNYDKTFDGSLMRQGAYDNCRFTNVTFEGTAGNNSVFKKSKFTDCKFIKANFMYSDFSDSSLKIKAYSSSYDFSDFTGTTIFDSKMDGVSFKECYFRNSTLENAKISKCVFSSSTFNNCFFKDVDFSAATLDFSEITDTKFQTVIFPFFGILNLVNGFKQIISQKAVSFKIVSSNYTVESEQYIEDIRLLKPVFYYENNFLALANIYAYDGEIRNAYDTILNGLAYACQKKNFSLMRHLCRFASVNNIFNLKQLKSFYSFLENNVNVQRLQYVEYHNYLNELSIAKSLLIDCPFNRDIMEINLKTNFNYSDAGKLTETMNIINSTLKQYAPDSNNHITVRHNSPIDLTIIVSDNVYTLILVFMALALVFDKTCSGIEKIQNILKNHQEIKLQKIEIEKMKAEQEKQQKIHHILLPDDFEKISYIVKPIHNLPSELRNYK